MNLNSLLVALLVAWKNYQDGRQNVIEKGDPTDPATGAVLTDAELAMLLQGDAQALVAKVDSLIAKHTPAVPATDNPNDNGG